MSREALTAAFGFRKGGGKQIAAQFEILGRGLKTTTEQCELSSDRLPQMADPQIGNKPSITVVGLVLLCMSQSWADTGGNGYQPARAAPASKKKTHYAVCYDQTP